MLDRGSHPGWLSVRRARPGEEDAVLIPCTRPSPMPPGGCLDRWQAAVEARRTWLREGMASDTLRVMVAWVPAPSEPVLDYPGVGPVPTETLSSTGQIPAGLVEYAPVGCAAEPVRGEGAWVIHCVWVIPPYSRRGIGAELVTGVLRDLRKDPGRQPCTGLAVVAYEGESWWGFFDYMPAAFFSRLGFVPVDRDGRRVLMYRALDAHAPPPYLIPPRTELDTIQGPGSQGRPATAVRLVYHSRCPAAVLVKDSVAIEFARRREVQFEAVDSRDRKVLLRHGVANGVYVNGHLAVHKVPSVAEVVGATGRTRPSRDSGA